MDKYFVVHQVPDTFIVQGQDTFKEYNLRRQHDADLLGSSVRTEIVDRY